MEKKETSPKTQKEKEEKQCSAGTLLDKEKIESEKNGSQNTIIEEDDYIENDQKEKGRLLEEKAKKKFVEDEKKEGKNE